MFYSSQQNGFSLIEVLIAMCLLAIMLLGIAEFQLSTLQTNQQAFMQNIATDQLRSMAELIQLSKVNSSGFLQKWNQSNKDLLPQGYGEVKHVGNHYCLYLYWRSNKKHLWKCDKTQIKNYACLELEVF